MRRYQKTWIERILILGILILGTLLPVGCGGKRQVYLQTADNKIEQSETQSSEALLEHTPQTAFVYVCGEVVRPAVYELPAGARICEAIAMAGGFTADAAKEMINQAEPVADGMMIRIPSSLEALDAAAKGTGEEAGQADGLLNLNTATIDELMALPGIGETKARSIVAYREENGGFSAVEDIMNVEGIKEGVYRRIKDSITVR